MDTKSELQLYDHVDFLDSTPNSRTEAATMSAQSFNGSDREQRHKAKNKQKKIAYNVSTLIPHALESGILV